MFEITINKEDFKKLQTIVDGLYNDYAYVPLNETEEKFTFKIGFLGEDKTGELQETLMEHIDEIQIEEIIG